MWDETFSKLSADYDLADKDARQKAYDDCVVYAQDIIENRFDANSFLADAARRLGDVMLVHLRVVEQIVEMPAEARLHLMQTNGEPTLTGNPAGLTYFGDLCRVLANANSPHEHFHLFPNEPPMWEGTYPLPITVYNKPDAWFDTMAERAETEESGSMRPLQIEDIAVVLFGAPAPPALRLTTESPYFVVNARYDPDAKTWDKVNEVGDPARQFVFTLQNDAQEEVEIKLHLDDPELFFLTHAHLERLREVPPSPMYQDKP